MKDVIGPGILSESVREILPDSLGMSRLSEVVMNGQLQTYLSILSNPFLMDQLVAVINGSARVSWCGNGLLLKSDGRTGKDWIEFFEGKVSDSAKEILRSKLFEPTTDMQYRVGFAPGRLGEDGIPSPYGVRFGQEQQMPLSVSMEFGCLLREAVDEDKHGQMRFGYGTDIMAIHTPDPGDPDEKHGSTTCFWLRNIDTKIS